MAENPSRRAGVTVVGHDNSTVTAISRGGNMDITAHDNCKVSLSDESDRASHSNEPDEKVNWTKWGTVGTGVGILVAIGIAVAQYAQTH